MSILTWMVCGRGTVGGFEEMEAVSNSTTAFRVRRIVSGGEIGESSPRLISYRFWSCEVLGPSRHDLWASGATLVLPTGRTGKEKAEIQVSCRRHIFEAAISWGWRPALVS